MHKRQKNKDTETEEYLFREKNYLLKEKKPLNNIKKNEYRSKMSEGMHNKMSNCTPRCNDMYNKAKINNEKMISDMMLVRSSGHGYIIEEYSRGIECFFNDKDMAGKNIFSIKSPISFMNEILEKVMDKSLNGYISSISILNMKSKEYEFGIFLRIEPLIPFTSKIIITFNYYISENSNPEFLYPTKDDFYLIDENDNIIRVCIEERRDNISTLHSYYRLCNQGNIEDEAWIKENKTEKYRTWNETVNKAKSETEISKMCINEKVLNKLTKRECEITLLVLEGNTNRFISAKLLISEGTVKKIIHNVYKKLNITSRVELTKQLLKN